MLSFENYFSYTPFEFYMSSHVLTLGFAVMAAAMLYFILTIRSVAPRYRTSSVLSVVVMISAFLVLFFQQQSWVNSFSYNPTTQLFEPVGIVGTAAVADGAAVSGAAVGNVEGFTNGYRYLNWLIDVPMLLFQILFIVEITGAQFRSYRNQFWFSGAGMIITGYIGQFYEVAGKSYTVLGQTISFDGNLSWFYIWGFISTVFFVHVLWLMYRITKEAKEKFEGRASELMTPIWWVVFISWMLYPGGYLMPILLDSAAGVVGRQLTYTVADITSKVIYGILLTIVAQVRSEQLGYQPEPLFGSSDQPATAAGD